MRRGRSGRISPYSTGSHSARGSSTTRGSERKRARNARTARGSGASGVPELTSSTPIRSAASLRLLAGLAWYTAVTLAHGHAQGPRKNSQPIPTHRYLSSV